MPSCHQHKGWGALPSVVNLLIHTLPSILLYRTGGSSMGGRALPPLPPAEPGPRGGLLLPGRGWGSNGHHPLARKPGLAPRLSGRCRCSAGHCTASLGKVSAVPGSLSEKTRKERFTLNPGKPMYFHCILILRDCLPRPRLSHGKEKPGSVTRGETCP